MTKTVDTKSGPKDAFADCPLIMVEWVDSHNHEGWRLNREIPDKIDPLICRTIGWKIQENDHCVMLAGTIGDIFGDQPQTCSAMTIPKAAILKIRRVKIV